MAKSAFDNHYAIAIYPQDTWKPQFKEKLSSSVAQQFFAHSGHENCEICCSCPVCRSLEELFDPKHPGPYDHVCSVCEKLYAYLEKKLGQSKGIILFSHYSPIKIEIIPEILDNKYVKKLYVLCLDLPHAHRDTIDPISLLKEKKITKTQIKNLEHMKNYCVEIVKYDEMHF